jgi:hypothetical protein
MLDDDYKAQIARLRDTFGANKYPDEMIRSMWWKLKGFSIDVFRDAITNLVCEATYAPKLAQIIEHCNQAKIKQKRSISDRPNCDYCRSNGVIKTIKKGTNLVYFFRCPYCDSAEFVGIKKFTSEFEEKFQIVEL